MDCHISSHVVAEFLIIKLHLQASTSHYVSIYTNVSYSKVIILSNTCPNEDPDICPSPSPWLTETESE